MVIAEAVSKGSSKQVEGSRHPLQADGEGYGMSCLDDIRVNGDVVG